MKTTAIAAAIATLIGLSVSDGRARAQTNSPQTNSTVTIRGCVAPAQRDGSLEARAAGNTATPETAPIDANRAAEEPVNAYMLTDATPLSGSSEKLQKPTAYTLQGLENELAKHKGHRVEISGTVMPPTVKGRGAGNKSAAEGIERVRVASVKMLGTECSPAKTAKP